MQTYLKQHFIDYIIKQLNNINLQGIKKISIRYYFIKVFEMVAFNDIFTLRS